MIVTEYNFNQTKKRWQSKWLEGKQTVTDQHRSA
jgi:hypothetical protein